MSALLTPASPAGMPNGLELLVGVVADAAGGRRLEEILERAGFAVVARAERPALLAAACANRQPHVVVLSWDAALPEATAAMRVLSTAMPQTRVVVVLRDHNRADIRSALRVGADGAVIEAQVPLALAVVVRAVSLGQASIPRELRGELDDEALSAREREVLTLVAEGLTNAAIAAHLCLSESTVKSHLSSAFSKLGVHSREEAAALVRQRRLQPGLEEQSSDGQAARLVYGGNT